MISRVQRVRRPASRDSGRSMRASAVAATLLAFLTVGCAERSPDAVGTDPSPDPQRPAANPERTAYFGDMHVHTQFSFDAYIFDVRATPDDAYRFAKGEAIDHAGGEPMQLGFGALDFQAVTDHGLYLGVVPAMHDPQSEHYEQPMAKALRGEEEGGVQGGFLRAVAAIRRQEFTDRSTEATERAAWQAIKDAAERHNDPGRFTTFIGYEYTTETPEMGNLHRNVIFANSAPDLPFSSTMSRNPEDLWNWMDAQRAAGHEALAIPHNSNGSNGAMFARTDYSDEPIDAVYAEARVRNEPLVEITQIKGTSETHPMLSPSDEWADFEIYPYRIATALESKVSGSYVREALIDGLALEREQGFNPYRFGFIGSTDTHNAGGTPEEDNYAGKTGNRDGTPELRGSVPATNAAGETVYRTGQASLWSASGLAGVWAEENTRESIYAAMRRRETFATSGPRLRVRFFAGTGYEPELLGQADLVTRADAGGVPMGGDLLLEDASTPPRFLAWAVRDPRSAPLQRLQIVKGWIEDGAPREAVFDVACAEGEPDPATHRCAEHAASVDLATCERSGSGADELKAHWMDPAPTVDGTAIYYVRVLENPSCRWSTWEAVRAGTPRNPDLPATIQERAWSSPIWVQRPR